jgi:hypothetical protein
MPKSSIMVTMRTAPRFLLTGFILLLLLTACGPGGPPSVKVDPAMLTLAPKDTVALIGVRMDHLRETPFWDKYVKEQSAPMLAEMLDKTHISPEEMWEVLAAYNGTDMIVMGRGKFTQGGLEPRLEWEGSTRTSYKGYLIVEDEMGAVTFMNASTAVAGRPARIRQIIDQRDEASGPSRELLDLIAKIDRSNQIWAVSRGGFASPESQLTGPMVNLDRVLRKIESMRAMGNLSDGLVFSAIGDCATPEDGETLRSALKALLGLARFGTREKPAIQGLYDTIVIGGLEGTVAIDATVSPSLLDDVLAEALSAATMQYR